MPNFIQTIGLGELPPGKATTVTVSDKEIALYNVDGRIYATNDACAHAGASLGWGKFKGKVVTCRAHGMAFDVTTGRIVGGGAIRVRTYPVQVEAGKILVGVDD